MYYGIKETCEGSYDITARRLIKDIYHVYGIKETLGITDSNGNKDRREIKDSYGIKERR